MKVYNITNQYIVSIQTTKKQEKRTRKISSLCTEFTPKRSIICTEVTKMKMKLYIITNQNPNPRKTREKEQEKSVLCIEFTITTKYSFFALNYHRQR